LKQDLALVVAATLIALVIIVGLYLHYQIQTIYV
jgi:hypothetical protein